MSEESNTESARYPIRDQQLRHTAAAMAAESHAGEGTPDVARGLYRFLTETTEPDLDAQIAAEVATWDAKGYTQEHDDEHGREHVLIQAMQYAIKRRYAAALALLERAAMTPMRAWPVGVDGNGLLPVGTRVEVEREDGRTARGVITQIDPDVYYVRTDDGPGGTYYPANRTRLIALPEPEDTTPRVGDTVRVREGLRHCSGKIGYLAGEAGGEWYALSKPNGEGMNTHTGPLSDFELVERAK